MASIFRPTYTRPIPKGAAIVLKGGRKYVRLKRGADWILAPLCENNPGRCRLTATHWYVQVPRPGKKPKRVKGYVDKRATEELAKRLQTEEDRRSEGLPVLGGGLKYRTIAESLNEYLDELARLGRSERHRRDIQNTVNRVSEGCGWADLTQIDPDAMRSYLAALHTKGRGARAQNAALGLVRTFLDWCQGRRWIAENPLAGIPQAKDDRDSRPHRRRAFNPAELHAFLQLPPLIDFIPDDRRLVYAVAAWTGFRRSTLRRLERGMLDLSNPSRPLWRLPARVLKGRRAATLPVSPDALAWLRPLPLDRMAAGDRLLPTLPTAATFALDLVTAGLAKRTGTRSADSRDARGRRLTFHSLRYSFCAAMARVLPVQKVKVLMCHANLAMTCDLYLALGLDDVAEEGWTLPAFTGPGAVSPQG